MFVGTGTCKTGRWPNSFRLASEQALLTEPAEMLRTESQRRLPREAKGDRPGGAGSGRITQKTSSWQRVPGRGSSALREQAVGLFWEVFLPGLIKPCYSPLSQPIGPGTGVYPAFP